MGWDTDPEAGGWDTDEPVDAKPAAAKPKKEQTAALLKAKPPPPETASPAEKALFNVATYPVRLAKDAAGLGEAALRVGSSALAYLPSFAGAAATPPSEFRTPERPALGPSDIQKELLDQATYKPRTEAGKTAMKLPEWVGEKYNKYAKEPAGDLTSWLFGIKPGTSIAGDTAINAGKAAPDLLLALLGGAGGRAAAAPVTAEAAATQAARAAARETVPAAPAVPGYISGVKAGPSSVRDATRATAKESGYQFADEGWDKVRTQFGGGKARVEKQVSEVNEANATNKLAADVGIPEGPLFPAVIEEAKKTQGAVYDSMKNAAGPVLEATPEFEQALRTSIKVMDKKLAYNAQTYEGLKPARDLYNSYLKKILGKSDEPVMKDMPPVMQTLAKVAQEQPFGSSKRPSAPGNIGQTLESAAGDVPFHFGKPPSASTPVTTPRYATLDTHETFNAISNLREQAKADMRTNKDMAMARLGIANQLENLFEQNLAKTGNQALVSDFREARKQFAKIYLLDEIIPEGTGMVNLQRLATLAQSPRYKGVLDGEFKTAADFATAFPGMARKGTGEVLSGVGPFDAMFAIGSIAAGHPMAAAAKLAPLINIRR